MPLENQTRGGTFGVLAGMLQFAGIIMQRNTNNNCKGQRTQLKIRFAICQM